MQLPGNLHRLVVGHFQRLDQHFVRGQGDRPDDAVLIVIGLDQRGQDAVDSDAVAAHDDRVQLLLVVEEVGPQRLGVFRTQLEDMARLDGMSQGQHGAAARARVVVDRIAKVGELVDLEIAPKIHACQVRVGPIGPDHGVGDRLDVAVGPNGNLFGHLHRPGEPDRGPGHFANHVRLGQFEHLGPDGPADLALVAVVVAADQHGNRLAVGRVDQGLDHLLRLTLQKTADLVDGRGPRRVDLFEVLLGHLPGHQIAAADLGPFLVGRIAAFLAVQHGIFAVVGRDHELVARIAADRSAFGLHGQVLQAAAIEDPAIGRVHLVIALP